MKRILYIILIAVAAVCLDRTPVSAGSSRTDIKGTVVEKGKNVPLAFATVTLLNPDKKIITGTTTNDNGEFKISALLSQPCSLMISFIGYEDVTVALKPGENHMNLGTIEIQPASEMLNTAVVTAKVPLIEQKLDKVIMNVGESVMAQTSNAFELLKKAPGISVDPDGNILLNGQSVDIWIDNRPSRLDGAQLETLLSALDGSTIEKLEIMQHPSARYDASGSGGIINIKTKKNFINGFYGNVSANYAVRPYSPIQHIANGSVNLNYRSKKANTYLTYSGRYDTDGVGMTSMTLFGNDYENKQYSSTDFKGNYTSHLIKGGADFYPNDKNTLGFLLGTTIRDQTMDSDGSHTVTSKDEKPYQSSTSFISLPDKFNSLDANLYYTYTFNSSQDITVNADYNYFDLYKDNYQSNKYYSVENSAFLFDPYKLLSEDAFDLKSQQFINIYSVKADYKQPFLKKGAFEAGVKWTETVTKNDMARTDSTGGQFIFNPEMSSKFNYTEHVGAAYVNFSYQFTNKWSAMAGLRTEYTNATGDWISAGTVTAQKYTDFFPSVYLGYMPVENWRLSASYSMRIKRPGFNQLNPFRMYVDPNTSLQGNPELKPQYTHELSLMAGFKSFLNFGFIYQLSNNFLSQEPTFDQTNGDKIMTWSNFGKFRLMGVSISITELALAKELLYLNANVLVSDARVKSKSGDYEKNDFFFQGYAGLTVVLPKNFKVELTANYQSGMPYGSLNISSLWTMYAGIKKSFWNNKATLSLTADDIFRTGNTNVEMMDGNKLIYRMDQKQYRQKIQLGFNYKFGNVQGKGRSNKRDDTSSRVGNGSGF